MKKKTSFTTQGRRADIGSHTIYRMLPNRYTDAVGPFVFLDYIAPTKHTAGAPITEAGTGAHPHRGIATLTYILNGEGEHFDSRENYAKVHSGGAQWMKAGNGIIHDESFNVDSETNDLLTHGFQFWISLPAKNKAEDPAYLPVQAGEIPKKEIAGIGWIKVIAGEFEDLRSMIPNYQKQFIYHIHVEAGKQFTLSTEKGLEYAAFLPGNNAAINGTEYRSGEFIEFDREAGSIEIRNNSDNATDIIIFGGETYTEPIYAHGPFVMNSQQEIASAYADFHTGKYGTITYEKPVTK